MLNLLWAKCLYQTSLSGQTDGVSPSVFIIIRPLFKITRQCSFYLFPSLNTELLLIDHFVAPLKHNCQLKVYYGENIKSFDHFLYMLIMCNIKKELDGIMHCFFFGLASIF